MPIDKVKLAEWTRKHDIPGSPFTTTATILYPKSLEDLIEICTKRERFEYLKAAGSHWALSYAALSDKLFIETHDPNNKFPAMGRTLYDVVPDCLSDELLNELLKLHPKPFGAENTSENEGTYLAHFETGKRVYQLYSELDLGDNNNERSLAVYLEKKGNPDYLGPWGFQSLGGAGGQTVFGALTTGTHGGDIKFPPIADSVVALHLVADGGKHYWIEPGTPTDHTFKKQLTDDNKLKALYGNDRYRGSEINGSNNFEIIRDDDIFNAVLISAGRFGIVYSVVMRVVRQYCLHEECRLDDWQLITDPKNNKINNPSSDLYDRRFLSIVVCLTPHENFKKNRCSITKRSNMQVAGSVEKPNGRAERRGDKLVDYDANIQGPRFEFAGNSLAYSTSGPNFLDKACQYTNFMQGAIDQIIADLKEFVKYGTLFSLGPIALVPEIGPADTLSLLIDAFASLLDGLFGWRKKLEEGHERLGQVLEDMKNYMLGEGAAGLVIWQAFANLMFKLMQPEGEFEAISYAVMDRHNYLDKSCNVNVDSIEVFFDATDPNLIEFINALIAYEISQENVGKAFVGYACLRFTGKTRALIGMEKYEHTCAVEIAGLADVSGTGELIDFAVRLCLDKTFRGILHWGQRNNSKWTDIEDRFGDSPTKPGGNLQLWRNALTRITKNGRLDGFSSLFTRDVGLEVVIPIIYDFRIEVLDGVPGKSVIVWWDCNDNPPMIEVKLEILGPTTPIPVPPSLPYQGKYSFMVSELGLYKLKLTATAFGPRKASKYLEVTVA